jgi:hypothetical protein
MQWVVELHPDGTVVNTTAAVMRWPPFLRKGESNRQGHGEP